MQELIAIMQSLSVQTKPTSNCTAMQNANTSAISSEKTHYPAEIATVLPILFSTEEEGDKLKSSADNEHVHFYSGLPVRARFGSTLSMNALSSFILT